MTDEEKAEEYAMGKAHEHYHFLFEENDGSPVDFAKLCYLDGLAEGRKETFSEEIIKNLKENTSVINSVIINKLSEKCEQLEKENAGLKKNLDRYSQKIAEQEETIDAQDDKINFYVAKMNENILKRKELEKENKISEEIIIGEQQEINELKKENEELKKDKEWLEKTDNEQTDLILNLYEQIEKMKNVGNCKKAMLCAEWNEKQTTLDCMKFCLNCKEWGLAE